MMITLHNDFHGSSTRVDTDISFSKRRISEIRNRLCGAKEYRCGDELGVCGPQDEFIPEDVRDEITRIWHTRKERR